jgi:hypothetical protein
MLKHVVGAFLRTAGSVETVPTVRKGFSYTQSSRKSRDASEYCIRSMGKCWTSWNLRVSGVETLTIRKDYYIDSRVRVGCNAISTRTLASRTVVLTHSLVILEQRISNASQIRQLLSSSMHWPDPELSCTWDRTDRCITPSLSMLDTEISKRQVSLVARSFETMLSCKMFNISSVSAVPPGIQSTDMEWSR